MPLYEYKCEKCGHRFEKIENFSAAITKKCPKCGERAERQIAPSALQFKGSGWYVTDYAGKAPNSSSSAESSESSSSDGASEKNKKKPSPKESGSKSKKD